MSTVVVLIELHFPPLFGGIGFVDVERQVRLFLRRRLAVLGWDECRELSATYWLSTGQMIPKDAAEQLIARLAWRGISGWPRAGEQS